MHTDIYIIHFLNSIALFLANRVVEESLLKATCFNQRRNFPFLECPLQQHILQRHSFHLIWESCLNRFWFAFLSQWFYRQCSTSKSTFRKQLSSWKTGVERESSVWTAQLQKNTTENPYQSNLRWGTSVEIYMPIFETFTSTSQWKLVLRCDQFHPQISIKIGSNEAVLVVSTFLSPPVTIKKPENTILKVNSSHDV